MLSRSAQYAVQGRQAELLQIAPWAALMRHAQQVHDTFERIAGVRCHQCVQEMGVALRVRRDKTAVEEAENGSAQHPGAVAIALGFG